VSTQLDLCLYRQGTLAEAIYWSLRNTCDHVQPATFGDYNDRARWLIRVLCTDRTCSACTEGACAKHVNCDLSTVTYERLLTISRDMGPRGKVADKLMTTTIKKRFVFLYKVMSEAHARGHLAVMPMFPKLRCDGRSRKRVHTAEQFAEMRHHLDEPWRTWATVGWFTGMHSYDLNRMRENWFKLDEPFTDAGGNQIAPGKWLRHNHKTDPNDEDLCWLPMEQDFHDWMSARTSRNGPTQKVTGRWYKAPVRMALACELAGVPRVSPIDLRRSRASIMSAAGHSDEYVRIWLGHKGIGWTGPGADGEQRKAQRPNIRTTHYYRPTAETFSRVR